VQFPAFADELEARTRIYDTLMRFCRGVDRKDWRLLASAFHEDATADHGWVVGNAHKELVPGMMKRHEDIDHSAHLLGNIACEFSSPTAAAVESYLVVMQRDRPDANGFVRRIQGALRYVDRFEKRDGAGWLIADRVLVWGDVVATSDRAGSEVPPGATEQRRDGRDPVEQPRAQQ